MVIEAVPEIMDLKKQAGFATHSRSISWASVTFGGLDRFSLGPPARCPFSPTFFVGRAPTKISYRKKGSLILTSPLEDLVVNKHLDFLGPIHWGSGKISPCRTCGGGGVGGSRIGLKLHLPPLNPQSGYEKNWFAECFFPGPWLPWLKLWLVAIYRGIIRNQGF